MQRFAIQSLWKLFKELFFFSGGIRQIILFTFEKQLWLKKVNCL